MINFKRWLPTFLAFPAGGLLALGVVGSLDDAVTGAAGGLLAGAVIGAAQWLALQPLGIGRRWIAHTAVAMGAGTAAAAVLTGAGTQLGDLMLTGLVAGAAVGAAQSVLLARAGLSAAGWTPLTAAAWPLGWLATWAVVGLNADMGFFVFGSSGALVVAVLSGFAVRRLAPPAGAPIPQAATAGA
jgi:hypothetical protein